MSHPGYCMVRGSCMVCTPHNNPMGLYCDHIGHGSDHGWCEPVDLAMINCDITLCQRI